MPAGAEVTVPLPLVVTERVRCLSVKVAVTVVAAVTVTSQGSVPEQPPPDQPVKSALARGAAVRVTTEPWVTVSVQSPPQLMPAGVELTVPSPVPSLTMSRSYWRRSNWAWTVMAVVTLTTQGAVPVQPPPIHPTKLLEASAEAVRVTLVP